MAIKGINNCPLPFAFSVVLFLPDTFYNCGFCNFRNGTTINWSGIPMITAAWTLCTCPPSIYGCRISCSITSKCQTNIRPGSGLQPPGSRQQIWIRFLFRAQVPPWSRFAICIIAQNGRRYKSKPNCFSARPFIRRWLTYFYFNVTWALRLPFGIHSLSPWARAA